MQPCTPLDEHASCHRCRKPFACGEVYLIPWRSNGRYRAWHPACGPTGFTRVYHCSTACYWRQLRARHRAEREHTIICRSCGGRFTPKRSSARTCSNACRQFAYRLRQTARPRLKPQAPAGGAPLLRQGGPAFTEPTHGRAGACFPCASHRPYPGSSLSKNPHNTGLTLR